MNASFIRQSALFLLVLFALMLTACGSQTVAVQATPSGALPDATTNTIGPTSAPTATLTPGPTHTASATPCLGFVAAPDSMFDKNFVWPYDDATMPGIPAQGMECAAPEEIVRQLMLKWLETVKTNSSEKKDCGLEDYKVDAIAIKATSLSQFDIVAGVGYHVKPGRFGSCGWISARGVIENDGWIKTSDTFGVYRENGNFRLVLAPNRGP